MLLDVRRRLTCEKCGRRNQRLRVGFRQAAVRDSRWWEVASMPKLTAAEKRLNLLRKATADAYGERGES